MYDYAHCEDCDVVINLDNQKWQVINDQTYCEICKVKEEVK